MVIDLAAMTAAEAPKPEEPKFRARLVARGGSEAAAGESRLSFEIKDSQVTIGRGPENGIQIDQPSVSAYHAHIREIDGRYFLYDIGSMNGTWVNENAVTGELLRDCSRISIGSSVLFFTQLGVAALRPGSLGLGSRGVLMVQSGPSLGRNFPVGDEDLVIGREPGDRGVQLDDPKLDARHALVRPTSDGCMIYDLGSSNGTALNDVPLAGTPLNNGYVIKLGIAELEFIREESS